MAIYFNKKAVVFDSMGNNDLMIESFISVSGVTDRNANKGEVRKLYKADAELNPE